MEYIAPEKYNYLDAEEVNSSKQSSNLKKNQETTCHPPLIQRGCQATDQSRGKYRNKGL